MTESASGASGGEAGTDGERRRRQRAAWLLAGLLLFLTVQSTANVESTIEDLARVGIAEPRWHVWTWQLSSVVTWLALMVPMWWLIAWARPPRIGWAAGGLIHAAATVPVSLAHVLVMVALRKLAYLFAGESYTFGNWPMELLYEYRKDLATYLMIVAFLVYSQWLLARPAPEPMNAPGDAQVLLVADGSVTHRVPVDAIESASAAGNYVEIVWAGRVLLHRSTLAALAERLGPSFARIHRGRIVRRAAVHSIETDRSGDFTVTLESGARIRGSRRYRDGL
jgi:hypothetical protein